MGYYRAGFEVIGVDINPQPHYPFEFHQADALTYPLNGFDVIHASPPCQPFTRGRELRAHQSGKPSTPDLVEPTRRLLISSGVPWIIENVPGAPLIAPITLCGSAFGLAVRRHRLFEMSHPPLFLPPCDHRGQGKPVGVYHKMNDQVKGIDHTTGLTVLGGRTASTIDEGQAAMGITWMTWPELREAIPPAYTQWIGEHLQPILTGYGQAQVRQYEPSQPA